MPSGLPAEYSVAEQTHIKSGTALGRATTTGSYAKNDFGLYDLHGNVWEWCQDPYRPNPASDKNADASVRVLRGGSWDDPATLCRSACRSYDTPERCYPYVGFRVVCEIKPNEISSAPK